jgi:hypothetical protein
MADTSSSAGVQPLASYVTASHTPLQDWKPKTIAFRYSLSYVKLFEVRFKALNDPRPFDPHRPVVDPVSPPVMEVPEGYDVIAVRHEPLNGPIQVLQRMPRMLRYVPRQLTHFYTDLDAGSADPFGAMSSKTRSTILRKVRNYEKFCGGTMSWSVYKSPEELKVFHRFAREIARKTYQERLFDSGLPETEAFRAQMLELAAHDRVRAFLLFHGDIPVAYLYTPAPDGFLIYDYLGYDPQYARHSPGTVLQYLALKAVNEEGRFPMYYWGYGYTQTKQIFSTGQLVAADIYYFRPSLRNYGAVWLHFLTDRFSEGAGRVLDRIGIKQRITQWLRRG